MPKRAPIRTNPDGRAERKIELGRLLNRRNLLAAEFTKATGMQPPADVSAWELIRLILDAEFPPAQRR